MNTPADTHSYVELRNINKTFGDYRASDDVSFSIEKGKLIGLLGPSGSGKTTILRILAGLETADSGDIYIDGKKVNDIPASKREIGFVFQNYALFRYKTVYDNIAFGMKIQKYPKSEIRDRVTELIELVGLKGLEKRYPRQLSGGQRQRVAFARALATQPQLLLLDEPFAAIDAKVRKELRAWLRDKIWNAAMKLNYTPNQSARQLKNGKGATVEKTYYINVLMTRMDSATSDPFFTELLHVIESEIHKNGCILSKVWYRSIFSDDRRCRYENVDSVIRRMCEEADGHNDGLIVIGKCNRAALKKLSQCYRSTVYVNRDSANGEVDEVICNGSQIARTAVEYLISLGHENIGYVGNYKGEARYKGYLETLHDHGLDIDTDYVINTKLSEVEGFEAMEHFMKSDKSPTGIYCANDITAIGMLKYLAKCKNRYYTPSIISSDGIEESQYTTPMLTTVEISKTDMGHFALQLLMDRLKGGHKGVARIELQCKLIKRDSCTLAEDSKWCEYYI